MGAFSPRQPVQVHSSEKDLFHHGCDLSPISLRSCCFPTLIFRSSRLLGTSDPSCGLSAGSDHCSGGSRGDEGDICCDNCIFLTICNSGDIFFWWSRWRKSSAKQSS